MPQRDYPPRATNQELASLLEGVFGPGIIVDTKLAKQFRKSEEDAATGGWYLYYNNTSLYFQIDLPSWHQRTLATELEWRLRAAMNKTSPEVRVLLPDSTRVIGGRLGLDRISMDIEDLRLLRKHGVNLDASYAVAYIMQEAVHREATWQEFEKRVVAEADHLLLGHPNDGNEDRSKRSGFTFSEGRGHSSLTLAMCDRAQEFTLPPNPESQADEHPDRWQLRNVLAQRIRDHGIENLLAYEDYSDRDSEQQRLVVNAQSVEQLWLTMEALREPKTFEAARAFIFETVCMLPANEFLFDRRLDNPAIRKEVDEKYPWEKELEDTSKREAWAQKSKTLRVELEQKPENIAWETFVKSVSDQSMTVGAVLDRVTNPPDGEHDVSEAIKAYLLQKLPLLSLGLPESERPLDFRPGAEMRRFVLAR